MRWCQPRRLQINATGPSHQTSILQLHSSLRYQVHPWRRPRSRGASLTIHSGGRSDLAARCRAILSGGGVGAYKAVAAGIEKTTELKSRVIDRTDGPAHMTCSRVLVTSSLFSGATASSRSSRATARLSDGRMTDIISEHLYLSPHFVGASMSHNTVSINQRMDQFDGHHSVWLFGYGSLIFKADFPYLDRRPATIANWTRRFWQGSHDHRGTPSAPGRVATLVSEPGAVCAGMALLITPDVFSHLDHREKNGYLRLATDITFDHGGSVTGLVYIATADNAAYLGPASEADIAQQIAQATGPSGPNSEYLLQLAHALRELGQDDPHVFAIERHLNELGAGQTHRP